MAGQKKIAERRQREAALAVLYDEYYDKIARYAFARIGDRARAEDMAGEVFLKALESLASYKERGVPMQAWLFRIAHNIVVDYLRKSARRDTVPLDTVEIRATSDVEATAEKHIQVEQLAEALKKLTPAQQQVISMRFFAGLSSSAVGKLLGRGDGAVREMQGAAIRALRQMLYEEP